MTGLVVVVVAVVAPVVVPQPANSQLEWYK
jgi:hypothetical protein